MQLGAPERSVSQARPMNIPEIRFSPANQDTESGPNQGTDHGFDSTERSHHAKPWSVPYCSAMNIYEYRV